MKKCYELFIVTLYVFKRVSATTISETLVSNLHVLLQQPDSLVLICRPIGGSLGWPVTSPVIQLAQG